MEKTKTFSLFQIREIYYWFSDFRRERIKSLPIKTQWKLLKIIKHFEPEVINYDDFEKTLMTDIQKIYATPEKATEITKDGTINWKIKDEFLKEYQTKLDKIEKEDLAPLLKEKTTYTFETIDINEILENLQKDTEITIDDLEMLDFINK